MNPAAAKEKRRSSGPSRSYLQTRVRGQRLYEAAFILAIVELSRRVHQAYAQAYDKQAAEWLLPQNTALTAQPSQKLAGCVFDIAITTNGLLFGKQIRAMKDEITRVFATAGQEINFVTNNEKANYYLTINDVGANYTNNADAVGLTPLNGSVVTNSGRVFVDRLTASATRDAAGSTAFNQNSNALAVGLGRAGSHEIAHNLLQQNYDASAITGVMHSGFKGSEWFAKTSEGLWKFTPAQIKQLNSLCGR